MPTWLPLREAEKPLAFSMLVLKVLQNGALRSKRAFETVWVLLASDRFSPFVDVRPPLVVGTPETRRYRIRYLDGDTPIGNFSPVVTVTTVP